MTHFDPLNTKSAIVFFFLYIEILAFNLLHSRGMSHSTEDQILLGGLMLHTKMYIKHVRHLVFLNEFNILSVTILITVARFPRYLS